MARSENLTGAFLMMASMASFTANDVFVKMLAGDMPLFQMLFLRGVLTSLMILVLVWKMNAFRANVPKRDWKFIALRMIGEIGTAYFFLTALYHMPIANITAILQALPLAITLAAALFLGESVGWRRLAAIAVGFVGVMLIVRPGADDFTIYSLYGLAAVAFVTLRDLATRKLSRETPSMFVTFITSISIMAFFGVASITEEWAPITLRNTSLIVAASVFIIGGYLFSIMVMRVGEIGFTSPFRYTGLVWALLLGLLAFGEWPSMLTLLGAAIVVGSGLFTLLREAQLNRKETLLKAKIAPN